MSWDHNEQMMRNIDLLRALRYSPAASPRYDMLSDAIIWEDEMPRQLPFADLGFLRHIWRFRIARLESGGTLTDDCWTSLRSVCPDWPGFQPKRCETPDVLEVYKRLKEDSKRRPLPEI